MLASVAGVLASLAVNAASAALLVYPVYFVLGNGLIAATIVYRRRRLAVAAGQAAPARVTTALSAGAG